MAATTKMTSTSSRFTLPGTSSMAPTTKMISTSVVSHCQRGLQPRSPQIQDGDLAKVPNQLQGGNHGLCPLVRGVIPATGHHQLEPVKRLGLGPAEVQMAGSTTLDKVYITCDHAGQAVYAGRVQ